MEPYRFPDTGAFGWLGGTLLRARRSRTRRSFPLFACYQLFLPHRSRDQRERPTRCGDSMEYNNFDQLKDRRPCSQCLLPLAPTVTHACGAAGFVGGGYHKDQGTIQPLLPSLEGGLANHGATTAAGAPIRTFDSDHLVDKDGRQSRVIHAPVTIRPPTGTRACIPAGPGGQDSGSFTDRRNDTNKT